MEYKPCCLQNFSQNPNFQRCPECGRPYIRCKSCSLLCNAESYCPVCCYPQFLWRLPSPLKGEEMGAVELVVENRGKEAFLLQEIRYGLRGMEKLKKEVQESLTPGKGQLFCLSGLLPSRGGQYSLNIEVVLLWQKEGKEYLEEELFVYHGETLVFVEPPENRGIHISGVAENALILISAPSYDLDKGLSKGSSYEKLPLHRSLALERKESSYPGGCRVDRKTCLIFPNLAAGGKKEFRLWKKNRLSLGRGKTEKYPFLDHTLRLYPLEGRNLEMTKSISTHHLDLVVMEGKLFVVDLSRYGTSLNGKALPRGIPLLVQDGDWISPFTRKDYIPHLSLQARFLRQGNRVVQVEFIKR